ncbi:MAG TPA: FAD-binding oxidoreductase [Candidatus Dormibacteraeota bacterium]|nr:FAD-binding oxidoreductase [Candidatus Dormibacteraeota bacterium]
MVVRSVAVEKPRTAEELASTLRDAASAGKAVTPVGGGRAAGMGGPTARVDVELHVAGLDRVIEHSAADMVVTVEAGITLEALQETLGKAGQFLPLDPFNSPGHTIGGLLATGWSGPLRLRYGSVRDFLIGIRVALPDGKLASAGGRVVKNVSGYDLMKLHVGALGTLGVIVAASFKVFPRPLRDVTVESHDGWTAMDRVMSLPMAPVAAELFSDGRVLTRFCGSPEAVDAMVKASEGQLTSTDVWTEHSHAAPARWARIAAPRSELRPLLESLPSGARWWSSPGVGIAHWAFVNGEEVMQVRKTVETAGGSLMLLAAPDDLREKVGAWGTPPATLDLMRRLKDAFDPHHVLNPGRFVV